MASSQSTFNYAGVQLAFDRGQAVQSFLDRYQDLDALNLFPDPITPDSWQTGGYGITGISPAVPNYPKAPQPRINTLYWPTGAIRWGFGLFLSYDSAITEIESQVDAASVRSSAQLKVAATESGSVYTFECPMHMLRPQRVNPASTGAKDFNDVWLVPLVDKRYFWQFKDVDTISRTTETWTELIGLIETALGETFTYSGPTAAFGNPDLSEFNRHYHNVAIMLEAIAHSVGWRVVLDFSGTVHLQAPDLAKAQLSTNLSALLPAAGQVAGTDRNNIPKHEPWPRYVTVAFPEIKFYEGIAPSAADLTYWPEDIDAADIYNDPIYATGAEKTIHATYWAKYCETSDSTPTNESDLESLALAYAEEYFAWLEKAYDFTWAGIQKWVPIGYDDHLLFEFGVEYPVTPQAWTNVLNDSSAETGIKPRWQRRYQTRVQSMPLSFGVDSILCWDGEYVGDLSRDMIVKTPSGGIPARSGTTLNNGTLCDVYALTEGSVANVYTMALATCNGDSYQILVYNISNGAVQGDAYVTAGLLEEDPTTGRRAIRYVIVESCNAES